MADTIGVLPAAEQLYRQGWMDPYPGTTQPWFTPMQEQGWGTQLFGANLNVPYALQNQQAAHGYLGGFNDMLGQMGQYGDPNSLNSVGASIDPYNNPYLDQAVQDANKALSRDYNQNVLPGIGTEMAMMGQSGGSRHGVAQGIAAQSLTDATQRQTSGMYMQGFGQGLDAYTQDRATTLNAWGNAQRNQLAGFGQTPNMYNLGVAGNMGVGNAFNQLGATQGGIGAQYQDMMGRYMAEERAKWDQAQAAPYQNLSYYSNMVNGVPMSSFGTQTSQSQGSSGWMDALGLGLAGYGLYDQFSGGGGGGGGSSWFTPTAPSVMPTSDGQFGNFGNMV